MATKIYLGYPPENIVNWIKAEAERKQQEMLITPLHFTANEPNSNVCLIAYDDSLDGWSGGQCDSWCSFVYSTDKMKTWNDYTVGQIVYLDECENKTVYIQAKYNDAEDNPNRNGLAAYSYDETYGYYQFDNIYHRFIIEGSVKAGGNIQFLLDNTGSRWDVPAFCYQRMFVDCRTLTQAPGLPADILADQCYASMFAGCSSLTKAPSILPAMILANSCYYSMFSNCESLTKAPELPAIDLVGHCYAGMFMGCTSLTKAPSILPAENTRSYCYCDMFSGCTSLAQAPELPIIIHSDEGCYDGCCQGMFYNCKSPFTFPNKTLDEVVDLIQYESMLGWSWWCDENYNTINPVEIICSDKTMLATFDENEYVWILTEK